MPGVYRDYDQAALDRQYDQATLVPNGAEYVADWLERSGAARRSLRSIDDVAYGVHPDERLDIFPAGDSAAPAVVLYHGGAWRQMSRKHFALIAAPLGAIGITTVVAGFSLAPAASLDVIVHQARSALAWVHANGRAHGIDPARLHVAGHSSGAHLAGLVALTDWTTWGMPADVVKGAALLSGLYDLEPVQLSARNGYLHLSAEGAQRLSAIRQLSERAFRPRLFVGWADGDQDEFRRQGRDFVGACAVAGWSEDALASIEIEGMNHFSVVESMVANDGAVVETIRAMASSSA